MNEQTPSSPDHDGMHRTLLRKISRLRGLTIASLVVNGLVLTLILLGILIHAVRRPEPPGGAGREAGIGQRGFDRPGLGRESRKFRGSWDEERGPRHLGQRPEGGPGGEIDHPGGLEGPGGFGGPEGGKPPTPEEMSGRMLDHLSRQLSLTDDQKAKLKPLLLEQATQMQQARETAHTQMKKMMDDARAKLRSLLTPDQQKQFDAFKPGPQ